MSVFTKCQEICADVLDIDPDEITEEASLEDDLGAEESDLYEIAAVLADVYGCDFTSTEIERLTTVASLVTMIESNV